MTATLAASARAHATPTPVSNPAGVAPPCFLYVESGRMLQELTTTKDIVPLTSVLKIAVIGSLALLPVLFKDRLKKKLD